MLTRVGEQSALPVPTPPLIQVAGLLSGCRSDGVKAWLFITKLNTSCTVSTLSHMLVHSLAYDDSMLLTAWQSMSITLMHVVPQHGPGRRAAAHAIM